ncbi:MAG: N-acetyl-gamma-glutamyl-phosphate reductase [Cytophagales bacterium]|nr:N-acetyl-gamma-glutamyl-phosphate reductase [Cytophagales bacterium]
MKKIEVGIVGGAGYTGGELIRILLQHPQVNLNFVHSKSNAGKKLYEVHTDLLGDTDLVFSHEMNNGINVLFLCMGHGESVKYFEHSHTDLSKPLPYKVIDLSQDFRPETYDFVYGLPELKKDKISTSRRVANPGCFATAIQLALLPLASAQLLQDDIHISAITGSTGAGQALSDTVHYTWRTNNISIYKPFAHQHLKEINQSIKYLQNTFVQKIHFVPLRGNFTRGIFATIYTRYAGTLDEAKNLYANYYKTAAFTHLSDTNPDLKQVINTNKCILYLEKHDDILLIVSIEDNLVKGASGQAVQNMNIMHGLDETTGLRLKPIAF